MSSFVARYQQLVPEHLRGRIPKRLRLRGRRVLAAMRGKEADQWVRRVMDQDIDAVFRALPPSETDTVEVSGHLRADYAWRSYESLSYPHFDLCGETPSAAYDLVICEQVLEHVVDPWRAAANLLALCRPGGFVLVNTPFLIKIHPAPGDYWRFTPDGLQIVLERAGLEVLWAHAWGNRACVRGNLLTWRRYRMWRSLRNEPEFPVSVWALARRPEIADGAPTPPAGDVPPPPDA